MPGASQDAELLAQFAKLSPADQAVLRRQALEALWRQGNLRSLLDRTQQVFYDRIKGASKPRYFLNCSRRLGKSFVLLAIAVEYCVQHPNARVIYVAPTAKDAADIATDNYLALSETCPKDVKAEYKAQSKELIFPNGSVIRFKATNGEHAKDLRGGRVDIAILDEAGTMDNFEHVLKSIIIPMTASTGTKARGRIYIATTPSETPGHDSMTVYEEYSRQGLVSEFTLNDNPRIPYDEKVEMLLEYGEDPKRVPDILTGKARAQMSRTRREYYGEWVTEAASAVVPSFTREAQDEIVREVGPPPFRDCFTALDPGYEHQTGALFAYFDFIKQQLVIEDEWAERHVGTPAIAAAISAREERHYPPTANVMRVSDHDKRLIRDLVDLYEMPFGMANKKDLKANAALLDAWVRSRQLVINPRCKNLIRQLQNATWNKKGNKIAEDSSSDNLDAHYDLVAAAIYLVRLVNTSRHRNPYPENWLHRGFDDHVSVKNRGPSGRSTGILGGNTPAGRKLHGRRGRK